MKAETALQQQVVKFYRDVGCEVYILGGVPRRTMQTPGLPDLWVFQPSRERGWWHEIKTVDGVLSLDQEDFKERCSACDIPYTQGGLQSAIDMVDP